jgi:isoquinoline 1-oxidoreductase beta subunit
VSAVDCGTVVNIDAAVNMAQGAVIDAIGNALYGEMTFVDGVPQKQNLDTYHQIRMHEAPKDIQVHFVKSDIHPTGLGEPPFPPTFAAVANALHKATGQRFCNQPFFRHIPSGEST